MMTESISIWKLAPEPTAALVAVNPSSEVHSLDEATRQLPGGGYTTFRSFGRYRVLPMVEHYKRLEETARLAGHSLILDRTRISAALHQAMSEYPDPNIRMRIILDLEREPGTLYILAEPLHLPTESAYQSGVKTITREMHRQNAKAKLTNFISTAENVRGQVPAGVNEVLMLGEDGHVLEGLSSNFFAVKDGEIWTAEQGVLSGITRSMVLELIRAEQIPLHLEGFSAHSLNILDEAFITSASRAVLPVTSIDGQTIGNGKPGPITRRLMDAYTAKVEERLEVP